MDAKLRDAISRLGTKGYVPGSSASRGWLYNPLPFPGCEKVPCHRANSPERWELIDTKFKGQSVLDLGCATGYFSFKAVQAGASSVLGIDHDPAAIEVCRAAAHVFKVKNAEFECADIAAPPERGYDIVFAMSVLNWLGLGTAERWLAWMAKNGSTAWIELPLKGDGRRAAHWLHDDQDAEGWLKRFFSQVHRAGQTYGTHCRRWRSLWKCS